MITQGVFNRYDTYTNRSDRLYVWMIDEMAFDTWYDASGYFDIIEEFISADMWGSGLNIEVNMKDKKWRKLK